VIVFVSDFNLKGSGYMGISIALCNELATRHNRKVTALGIGYNLAEHNWPFTIIPVEPQEYPRHVAAIMRNFNHLHATGRWDEVDAIVVALDVPVQEKFMDMDRGNVPYVGIFPIESGPLCQTWAMALSRMSERLVISQFGARMMEDAGVDATFLPVGIDTRSWRRPSEKERRAIRQSLGFRDDEFVILTVCDNQERKNLSATAEAVSLVRKKVNAKWMLVTRVDSPVGWKLDDMAQTFGIAEALTKFDKGLPFDRLWFLYAASDVFLLTAKAEGLCLPILEAMACGLPVVATDCTAMPEHLFEDPDWSRIKNGLWEKGKPRGQRGFPIPVHFTTMDPWGNSMRSFVDPRVAADIVLKIAKTKREKLLPMLEAAAEYAASRTWQRAGNVLNEAISRAISSTPKPEAPPVPEMGVPAVIPRPVPVMESQDEQE